ncbi:MAG: hypothetical protein Q8889_01355 [Candidatus Phytoplasma australasiaticum]|nr:hypothetical protein [Candidatus Phytoplasma australasiaticum]MDV3199756.1 hypothetical protein [Candidatus Phytoplasma australasiaticum]
MLKKIQLKLFIVLLINLFVINFYGVFINKQGNLSNSNLNNIKAFFDINWSFLSKNKEIQPNTEKQLITENSIKKDIKDAEKHVDKIVILLKKNDKYYFLFSEVARVKNKIETIKGDFAKWINKYQETTKQPTNILKEYVTTLNFFNKEMQNINDRIIKIEKQITQKKITHSNNELFINSNSRNR